MGLLDMWNQGKNWASNQDWSSNRVDPGANAQALMGGTPMQYNQQPQSLIADTPQVGTGGMVGPVSPLPGDINVNENMNPYITPQTQPRPDFTNVPLDTWQDPATAGGHVAGTGYDTPRGRMNEAPVNSLLMGNAQTPQGVVGVDSNPEQVVIEDPTDYSKEAQVEVGQPTVTSTPFQWPWEAFGNQQTMQEQLTAQEIARQKLIERGLISPK